MPDFDGTAFGREIVASVKEFQTDAMKPALFRLEVVENGIDDIFAKLEALKVEAAALTALSQEANDRLPELVEKAIAEQPAPIAIAQISQIVEALAAYDLTGFLKDAIAAGVDGGGIEVMAPWEVATEMTAAISMLSEPAPVTKTIERGPDAKPLRPRTFHFDRDERGLIVAAHEDYGS